MLEKMINLRNTIELVTLAEELGSLNTVNNRATVCHVVLHTTCVGRQSDLNC